MAKRKRPAAKTSSQNNLIATTIREKFHYILIGLFVIILLGIFAISLFNNKTSIPTFNSLLNNNQKQEQVTTGPLQKVIDKIKAPFVSPTPTPPVVYKYRIQAGDSLWTIAETKYGSGFNAYDLAKANNIENPSLIEVGTIIVIPSLTPKAATQGEITASAASTAQATSDVTTYVVKQDDTLWMIAEQMYGDGFSYVRIVEANNIQTPSIIYPGTNLNIPR